jgi:hypothetical protein
MKNFLLTPEEQQVAFDASWIYHKNSVINKVMELMGAVHRQLEAQLQTALFPFPVPCLQQGGKISKGERYKELPYVILDYPRYFNQEAVWAFRTMFWWGHYFSCTLHLAGTVKAGYVPALQAGYTQLAAQQVQVYMQDDPWQHDFENGNYRPVAAFKPQEWETWVEQREFIKLAKPFALEIWEKIIPEAVACYTTLLAVISYK